MRIRTFIFAASTAVSVIFFGGSYWAVGNIFGGAVRDNAVQTSEAVARITFGAMYELMSAGWRREQAESFLRMTHEAANNSSMAIQIYRSQVVIDRFDEIEQPPFDDELKAAMRDGKSRRIDSGDSVRHIYPLVAEEKCLRCHRNAEIGSVLGAVEVRQNLARILQRAQSELLFALLAFLPLLVIGALAAVWWVSRRIERSVDSVKASFDSVNAVSDLRRVAFENHDLGFDELNRILTGLDALVVKLRGVAVDKDILKFEIGLLEKFVITSEVVRDWREYIGQLLVSINRVITAHVLFSVFKIDDELFDLEIFWLRQPTPETCEMMERHIRLALTQHSRFSEFTTCTLHHNVILNEGQIDLPEEEVSLRVKSFFVESPKIGGIVGIGVHADEMEDETRHLVMDSVLSTLLNVVGSVKAIYKYTRDLEYYATRDPLTDLFNQRVFWEMAGYEIERARRHDYKFGLLLIDLDNFKVINDSFGHTVGDRYLQQFARRVQETLRAGDIFARYGGDEFVVILPESDLDEASMAARRVLEAVSTLSIEADDGHPIHGTCSIGLAIFPDHAAEAKDLFLFADNMMYKAKAGGKDRVVVPTDEDIVEVFRDITQKSVLILDAIEHKRVVPFFQPILDVESRRIVAYEVLSRIEVGGEVMRADEFVEIAEKMGVIHRLDTLVIERALASLQAQGHDGYIFINLSPRALVLGEFARDVKRIVAASGVAPERVVFEITERDTVKNLGLLERFLTDLKMEGFKLAIDDFGSGFSSFHYLRRFPIDFLKIEGEFIANMLNNSKDLAFVSSIRSLALDLGITMVAEFVESAEVLDELGTMGVHLAQGYYVGRPARDIVAAEWSVPGAAPALLPETVG